MAKLVQKVQQLDQHVAPHRLRGDTVLAATAKAVREIRRAGKGRKR